MRKFVIVFVILGGIGALLFVLFFQVENVRNPVDFLPVETLAVIEWHDPVGFLSRFEKSRLGRKLQEVDWQLAARESEIADSRFQQLNTKVKAVLSHADSPLAKEFFGQEVVLALVKPDETREKQTVTGADCLVAIVKPKHRASFLDFVAGLFTSKSNTVFDKYQGVVIRKITPDPTSQNVDIANKKRHFLLYTATTNGFLLAALSPGTLKQCINRVHHRSPGLASDRLYSDLRKRSVESDMFFCFMNFDRLGKQQHEGTNEVISFFDSLSMVLKKSIKSYGNLRSMAVYGYPGTDHGQVSAVLQYDAVAPASDAGRICQRDPDQNETLELLQNDQLFYLWTNYFDLSGWLDQVTALKNGYVEWVDRALVVHTGYTRAELSPLFGEQFGLSISDLNADHYVPLPMMCFYFQIRNQKQVELIIEKALTGVPVKRDIVNTIPVTSIQAAGGLLQPSYAYINDLLVVTDSRRQIESIITHGPEKKMINDPLVQDINSGLTKENNLSFFIRSKELIGVLQIFVSWADTMFTIEDKDTDARIKTFLERVITPVLDGLKMFQITNGRLYNTNSELRIETKYIVNDI